MRGTLRIFEILKGLIRSPRFIVRANGYTKCGLYLLDSSLAAALLGTRRVSARQGGAGEKPGFFDYPALRSFIVLDVQTNELLVYRNNFSLAY